MKNKLNIFSTFILILLLSFTLLNAMSYSVNRDYLGYNLIYASGQIRYGDLYKLKRKYRKISKNRQTIVVFSSNGGEMREGIKIGRFLKDNRIGSAVIENGICASSCALAFLGGRSKNGYKLMILPESSGLGLHAFYYKNGNYVKLNRVQRDLSSVYNYASYVNIPNDIMSKMFSTSSKGMYWISRNDRRALNLKNGLSRVGFYNHAKKNRESISYTQTLSAVNYIKKYIANTNNAISLSRKATTKYDNIAFNSRHKVWLAHNLRYTYIKNIKQLSGYKVRAKVIYSLKNGQRLCSINVYNLTKFHYGKWQILSKTYKPCSNKSRKTLRVLAKALP